MATSASPSSPAAGDVRRFTGVALPGPAYALLVQFTGREPTEKVRARLRTEQHADLADELLIALHQQRILLDADAAD